MAAGHVGIGQDAPFDLGVEPFDMALAGVAAPAQLGLEEGGAGRRQPVGERGALGLAALRALTSSLTSSSAAGGGVSAGSRAAPITASSLASTASVLASVPAASANSRARSGLTTATTKPAACSERRAAR